MDELEGAVNPRDPMLRIEVDHSQYYRWEPVPEGNVYDDSDPANTPAFGDAVPFSRTVDSTMPGYRQYRVVVSEPTTTVTDVHLPSLAAINDDRELAGLERRSHRHNLCQHLMDGPWDKHFPIASITAIRCAHERWEKELADFFMGLDDDYLGGA